MNTSIRPPRTVIFFLLLCVIGLLDRRVASAQVTTGLQFVPVKPCRVLDTRNANGTFGGPIIGGGSTRNVPIRQSTCNIPATAQAYALNVTAVPPQSLGYLSIWPTGLPLPVVSTLNSLDGRIVANMAIVPAGVSGSISIFVSSSSHVVLDINGYFVPASTASSLAFYPITPCRVADTRGNGFTGGFGGPIMTPAASRTFSIRTSPCGIPATAQAYALSVTVVPSGPLGYLTLWPAGQVQPLVSTLNAPDGDIVANAAIVPAGTGGGVSVAVTHRTHVILDVNGYFAPRTSGAEALYTVPPCRLADTRGNGFTGPFGAPAMSGGGTRAFPVPAGVCNVPTTAQAYSMNVTVVPPGTLGFLTAWPAGSQRPNVSTLNSPRGKITANAALVPAGQSGAVSVFVSHTTQVILDVNGFFGPIGGTPAILSSPVTAAAVGTAYSYAVLATNPNPPDPITFSLFRAPAGMTVNATTGLIQWTPTAQQPGTHLVEVRATDAHNRRGAQTFNVTVPGDNPGGSTVFVPGTITVVGTRTIGPGGGTITISGSGTAADGIRVVFPVGALDASVQVRILFNRGSASPVAGVFSGAALSIEVAGSATFNRAVSVIVPNTGGSGSVPVPYSVDADGTLRPVQVTSVDRQAGTFTFDTFRAALFTWLFAPLATPPAVVTTPYLPANDGFQVTNDGPTYKREGECFGMTAFSLWFHLHQKAALGKFFPKYMEVLGRDSLNRAIHGQDVIATRAFISIIQKWTSYLPEVRRQKGLTAPERFASIRNAIAETKAPVLIYLYHATGSGNGAHSVLAYEVDSGTGKIAVYDPNRPGTVQHIQYSSTNSKFDPYCNSSCYDGIIYNGDGTLNLTEPYSNIIEDAEDHFQNSAGATIDIESHTNGQVLATRLPTLSGIIQSGEILITRLTVVVGSTEHSTDVPLSGEFHVPVALSDGANYLTFRTEGVDDDGQPITTSNNYDLKPFTLNATVPTSVVLMTLTWNKDDTDLDTYVIDPTGDYSSYYHRRTADGGVLDQDVTTGFGPEHWTLLNTDVVRYDQPYKFRVHYYSDNNNGPANYTVTIELYNGTSRQTTFTYSGALSVDNSSNSRPDGTGPDWADIATVRLTRATENATSPAAQVSTNGELMITVPVPAPEERIKPRP